MTYIFIFIAKVIENTLSTLRLIIVANGKKLFGAILNLLIAIAWVISTSLVVQNFKDIFSIIYFSLGCFVGSYVGSLIEGKLGIGSNMLITIVNNNKGTEIQKELKKIDYPSYLLKGDNDIILVLVKRKKRREILNIIYRIDNEAIVISEVAHQLVQKFSLDNQ